MLQRRIAIALSLTILASGRAVVSASSGLDPRQKPVSVQQIRSVAGGRPLELEPQLMLLARAASSGLQAQAYEAYARFQEAHRGDGRANLMRAAAAWTLARYHRRGNDTSKWQPSVPLIQEADEQFAMALKRLPGDPIVQREAGYYYCQEQGDVRKGKPLLEKAAASLPDDPQVHHYLGVLYNNPSLKGMYDRRKAEQALRKAVSLDSLFAEAHWALFHFYLARSDHRRARASADACLKVSLPEMRERPAVKRALKLLDAERNGQ